ncbi:MAG: DinB family protein [Dehalococcoidia bacterium]|jgi:hypothetical protein|nr:DinB family protein [Dehalococcoidia bacterium]
MDIQFFATRFAANAEAIERFLRDIDDDCAKWKPAEDEWSILEVIGHICDEEMLDFRTRIDYTLNRPGEAWPPFDPLALVEAHGYAGKDIHQQLTLFLSERKKSIEWLNSLESPNLDLSYQHPRLGALTAGSLLASWLAHDYLHLPQISNLYVGYLSQLVAPHSLTYADPAL